MTFLHLHFFICLMGVIAVNLWAGLSLAGSEHLEMVALLLFFTSGSLSFHT